MYGRFTPSIQQLIRAVLTPRAVTPPGVRQAIVAYTAALAGRRPAPSVALPAVVVTYINLVARDPATITDADMAALRDAGYAEEAIFELTVSAALGTGLARLERGLAALNGGQ